MDAELKILREVANKMGFVVTDDQLADELLFIRGIEQHIIDREAGEIVAELVTAIGLLSRDKDKIKISLRSALLMNASVLARCDTEDPAFAMDVHKRLSLLLHPALVPAVEIKKNKTRLVRVK
jgi:hypothetical protein